jgi:Transposase DDE domain group 1
MADEAPLLPGLSAIAGKPVQITFDAGRLTSDGGVLVLAEIERRLGIAERLARCLEGPRAPDRVEHGLAEMIRFRALLIAAGYEDANDCDALRADPAFKMAVGRLPESAPDLCSQPTMCRLENLPGPLALKRMMAAMIELFCDSFAQVPQRIVLDIDDTEDRVHGGQQLALFHAHYDSRCFLPIHIYEATTGKPVAVILRPGKTPAGAEVALILRHVVKAIRARWPRVEILIRGDSHYARHEAMTWCERNRIGYVFGLAGNPVLLTRRGAPGRPPEVALGSQPRRARRGCRREPGPGRGRPRAALRRVRLCRQDMVGPAPGDRAHRGLAPGQRQPLRRHQPRRRAALALRERLLRPRPGREPDQGAQAAPRLRSDLLQQRHRQPVPPADPPAAYWLLHTLRGLAPTTSFWRDAQFDTIRLTLIKVAARVTEMKTRIKVALPTCYPHQASWALLAARAVKLPP